MYSTLRSRALTFFGSAAVGVLILTTPAAAEGDAPAGNNGHIKIDDVLMDGGSESVPHPGCSFVVDFFGYDVGSRTATISFEGQEPTGGGALMTDAFTFDVVSRDTGNELNFSRTVDLSSALVGIEPSAEQGWHVKLTAAVDGAQGADSKSKVFWVSQCSEPALVEAESAAVVRSAAANAAWLAAEAANASQAAVLSANATQSAEADQLPRTGATTDALALVSIALLACGVALVVSGRRFGVRRA